MASKIQSFVMFLIVLVSTAYFLASGNDLLLIIMALAAFNLIDKVYDRKEIAFLEAQIKEWVRLAQYMQKRIDYLKEGDRDTSEDWKMGGRN